MLLYPSKSPGKEEPKYNTQKHKVCLFYQAEMRNNQTVALIKKNKQANEQTSKTKQNKKWKPHPLTKPHKSDLSYQAETRNN